MNIALYIAKRYFFSTKRKNAVHIITGISVLGVAVGTLALVVVLSVFNGFESLIKSMYHSVSSDFVVTSVRSKDFSVDAINFDALNELGSWQSIQEVYEEKVLLRYDDREQIAKIRGVNQRFAHDSLAIENYIFKGNSFRYAPNQSIIGQSLAYTLSISAGQFSKPLKVFVPNTKAKANSMSERPFLETFFYVSGIYSVQPTYDASYVITSLEEVQLFLDRTNRLTQIELNSASPTSFNFQEELKSFFGADFEVKNRYQQNEFLYKVLQTEKWAIFFILSFILLIATFNIVASVIIIMLEKRHDIISLIAIGVPEKTLQSIFFYEGLLITFFGALLGLIFGIGLCLLQQKFGLLQLGAQGSFIVNTYPVEVQLRDILFIILTVVTIGVLITLIPVKILKKKFLN